MLKERDGWTLNEDFVFLRDAFVQSSDVAADDVCRADYWETGMWEGGGDVSERDVFKTVADEGVEVMHASMSSNRDGSGTERVAKREKMEVRTASKVFVYGDEDKEKNLFAITYEIWLTVGEKE